MACSAIRSSKRSGYGPDRGFPILKCNPKRVGKPLHHEFEGMYSARVGPYRILYEIGDVVRIVADIRMAHPSTEPAPPRMHYAAAAGDPHGEYS